MKTCRICRRPVAPRAENPAFPLCSERCRMVDLGRWMVGDYVVSSPLPDGQEPLPRRDDDDDPDARG